MQFYRIVSELRILFFSIVKNDNFLWILSELLAEIFLRLQMSRILILEALKSFV